MAEFVDNVVEKLDNSIVADVAEFVHDEIVDDIDVVVDDDDAGEDSVDGTDDGADHKNNNQDDRCVGMYHNTGMNVVQVVKMGRVRCWIVRLINTSNIVIV